MTDTLVRLMALAARELRLDVKALDSAAPLRSFGVDSLALMEFFFKVENEFDVELSDEDLRGLDCLADLGRHVDAMLRAARG